MDSSAAGADRHLAVPRVGSEALQGRRLRTLVTQALLPWWSRGGAAEANYRVYKLQRTATEWRALQRVPGALRFSWRVVVALGLRTGVFVSAEAMAAAGILPRAARHVCPVCGGAREDLVHVLVSCPSWAAARESHLVPVLRAAGLEASFRGGVGSRERLAFVLLGGRSGVYRAPSLAARLNGSGSGGARRKAQVPVAVPVPGAAVAAAAVAVAAPPVGVARARRSWLVGLSRFVGAVWPARMAALSLKSLRRDASHGMAGPGGPRVQWVP